MCINVSYPTQVVSRIFELSTMSQCYNWYSFEVVIFPHQPGLAPSGKLRFVTWNFGSRRWCLNSCSTEEIHHSSYDSTGFCDGWFFEKSFWTPWHIKQWWLYPESLESHSSLPCAIDTTVGFREKILNCTDLHMHSLGPSWRDEI